MLERGTPDGRENGGEVVYLEANPEQIRLMERIYLLEEREVRATQDLITLAFGSQRHGRAFAEFLEQNEKRGKLHEADRIDELVEWSNDKRAEHGESLLSQPGANGDVQNELVSISRELAYMHSLISASGDGQSENRDTVLKKWLGEAERLASDLYSWGYFQLKLENTDSVVFEAKRAKQEIKKLESNYESPYRLAGRILEHQAHLTSSIRKLNGITEVQWKIFVSRH